MTFGVTVFLSVLQDYIFVECQQLIEFADKELVGPATVLATQTEGMVVPLLEQFDKTRVGKWMHRTFGAPTANDIQAQIDRVYQLNERVSKKYIPILKLTGWCLFVANLLLIITICHSYLWLFFDALYGPRRFRTMVIMSMILSVPVNYFTYSWLLLNGIAMMNQL